MRATAHLCGMLARQYARRPAPPSLTTSNARSNRLSSGPIGTPTTVTPPSPKMQKPTLSRSENSSAVEACHFGGIAAVFHLGGTRQHCLRRRPRIRRRRQKRSWGRDLAASVIHASSFPADRGSASRLRAASLTPPAWLHIDDARSSFSSSEASWTAARCMESSPLVNAISHGSGSNCPRSPPTRTSVGS